VGHVTSGSAALWFTDDGPLRVELRPLEGGPWSDAAVRVDPGPHPVLRAEASGLEPGRAYAYRATRPGEGRACWSGTLRTAPRDDSRAPLRLAAASCAHQVKDRYQPSWDLLRAQHPQVLLLLGDNAYADSTDPDVIWSAHLAQRRIRTCAGALRELPTYAIWDDHDFGPNNAHGLTPGKAGSLATFRELWANPSYGLPGVPGIFFRARWGPVELFALDVRYHRSPERSTQASKTIVGGAQLDWLARGLSESDAPIKLVASGSTIALAPDDTWSSYPAEHARLLELLGQTPGTLFLSGDLHRCAVERHATPGGRGVWEVISSGIAHEDEQGFVVLDCHPDPQPRVELTVVRGDGSEERQTLELR